MLNLDTHILLYALSCKHRRIEGLRILVCVIVALLAAEVTYGSPRAYIANQESHSVSVVDLSTQTVIAEVSVGSYPTRVNLSRDGSRVYVASPFVREVAVIDSTSLEILATLSFDWQPNAASESFDGDLLHVVGSAPIAQGAIFSTDTWELLRGYEVSDALGPVAVANHPSRPIGYVIMNNAVGEFPPCGFDTVCQDALVAIDLDTAKPLWTLALGDQLSDVVVDPRGDRLYVSHHIQKGPTPFTSITTGVLSIFDILPDSTSPSNHRHVELAVLGAEVDSHPGTSRSTRRETGFT